MADRRRVLLLSTSTVFGGGYLDYAETEVRNFLGISRACSSFLSRFMIRMVMPRERGSGLRGWVTDWIHCMRPRISSRR